MKQINNNQKSSGDDFNKDLSMFLMSCRETALKELTENNEDYRKLLADITAYSKKIHDVLPDEYEAMTDCLLSKERMEINYIYFRGFRDCINLYKRFDSSFVESLDFEKFFV